MAVLRVIFDLISPFFTAQTAAGILITIALLYIWYIINKPLNRVKNLGDLGYVLPSRAKNSKQWLIRQAQRLRKSGGCPPVYPNGWFCIAESPDLKPGDVSPVVIFGQQLAVFRSYSGQVYVLDAYCPHLGANLACGGRVVRDDCLQCPFHGWSYSGKTGKCVNVPYSNQVPDKAKVDSWPVVERNKHIYIWYHCDGLEPTYDIPVIPQVDGGEWIYKGRFEHELNSHIEETPENAADIAHLHHLHLHGFNMGSDLTKLELDNYKPWSKHYWTASWNQKAEPNSHIGVMTVDHILKVFGITMPFATTHLEAEQIGPGIVYMMFDFGILGKGTTLHHLTPEEPLLQRSRFVMYTNTRLPSILAKLFLLAESGQFERDITIWNNKCYRNKPYLVKEDATILRHRRWFTQFFTENSPRLQPDGSVTNMDRIKSINDW